MFAGSHQSFGILFSDAARVLGYPHTVVTDVAGHTCDLGLGIQRDIGVCHNLLDQLTEQVTGIFTRWEDSFQLCHAAAQEG